MALVKLAAGALLRSSGASPSLMAMAALGQQQRTLATAVDSKVITVEVRACAWPGPLQRPQSHAQRCAASIAPCCARRGALLLPAWAWPRAGR